MSPLYTARPIRTKRDICRLRCDSEPYVAVMFRVNPLRVSNIAQFCMWQIGHLNGMVAPSKDWKQIAEQASHETDSAKLQSAVQELIEALDEEQRLKSQGLNYRNLSGLQHNFPPQLQTSVDKLKDDAKPCPHCRGRGRVDNGSFCEVCTGTGEIKANQGTT